MKNELKDAIDARLSSMDWHGESRVWRRVRRPAARTVRLRTAVIACLLVAALSATALAARAFFLSGPADAATRARAALKQTYGLTDDTIGLFLEMVDERDDRWTARYTMPVYGEWAGEYIVTGDRKSAEATWSKDGETFPADGSLSSAAWGEPQLEKLRAILRDRQKAEEALNATVEGGLWNATLEERAAVDAPLTQLPISHDAVNTLPGKEDLSPDEAEAMARALLANEYRLDEGALDGCTVHVAFVRTPEGRREYRFLFQQTDGGWHRAWFTSPEGAVTRIESSAAMRPATLTYDPEDVAPVEFYDMTIEERYACAEAKRQAGRDPKIWNAALPEEGELTQNEALCLAKDALYEQFGVTAKALDAMELYLECTMNYEREGDPVKMWFFWFQRGVDSYQIELRAGDGVIEYIRYDDNSLGKG